VCGLKQIPEFIFLSIFPASQAIERRFGENTRAQNCWQAMLARSGGAFNNRKRLLRVYFHFVFI
jgi:hypothetical protein